MVRVVLIGHGRLLFGFPSLLKSIRRYKTSLKIYIYAIDTAQQANQLFNIKRDRINRETFPSIKVRIIYESLKIFSSPLF